LEEIEETGGKYLPQVEVSSIFSAAGLKKQDGGNNRK